MVGQRETILHIILVDDEHQQSMRSSLMAVLLFVMLIVPPSALADAGRAAPSCTETTAAEFSSSDAIADGECVKVSLGVLMPGDVFDININIIDDAMDIFVFDQNTIQPYDLGQSYRSSYEQIPSTESALGSYSFHWKVPSSLSQKTWYIVFDNLDHDGDQGLGDLGGNDSRASLNVQAINEAYWTPYHDLIQMEPDSYQTLLSGDALRLDAGTTVVVSAWSLESQDADGSTTVGASVNFDASSTPNRLNQIAAVQWDFDSSVDSDNDGTPNNDADATGFTADASWPTPGDRTVTLWVTSPTGEMASTTTMIAVNDVIDPVARIGGNGQPVAGGWRLLVNDALVLNCDSSSDDHLISACAWNLDGSPFGQNSSVLLSWASIGTHEVVLTVTDASGNTNATTTTVVVIDNTLPVLQQTSLNVLPSSGMIDQSLTCTVEANDPFDDASVLRYHWDLNPELDSDGNGDARDDPDRTGSTADLTFKQPGTYTVVVTVFDPSNNSDDHVFTLNIGEPTEEGSIAGMLLIVLFIGTLTMGIALVGHRRWQHGIAVDLLVGRGLSVPEAKAHIANVVDARKTPLFASATVLAGLDVGEVTSTEAQEEQAKAAELESIYGTSNSVQTGSAFAPPAANPTFSAGSQLAASDAMALFNDEPIASEPEPPAPTEMIQDLMPAEAPQTVVKSGGVQLPAGTNLEPIAQEQTSVVPTVQQPVSVSTPVEQATTKTLTCASCGAGFSVTLPSGVPQAVVACPSCNADNIVTA